jgi:hypothetical protein
LARDVKFSVVTEQKGQYKFCTKYFFCVKKINKNIATVLNFEVFPGRFNVHKIQGDSKLLSGFPWPIIFKPNKTK